MVVAIYCYLVPFFRPLSLTPAFLMFLLMASATPPGFLRAICAVAILALIFGIKDLVIVNRKAAYQLLVLAMSFAGSLLLFNNFVAWSASGSFLSMALASILWFWLLRNVPERQDASVLPTAIAALLLFEIGAVMFFLPINFFAQATLLFLASALLFEAATDIKRFSFMQALAWGAGYAAISLLVVFLASWKV